MLKGYKGVNSEGEIAGTGFKQNLTCDFRYIRVQ